MNEHTLKKDIYSILRILSTNDNLTQRDLRFHLNISLGKTNYLLKCLAEKGFLEIRNFSSTGKKIQKVRYIVTEEGVREKIKLVHHFLAEKEAEYHQLKTDLEKYSSVKKDSPIDTNNKTGHSVSAITGRDDRDDRQI